MAGVDEPCRCGGNDGSGGLPCSGCWDHTADDALVDRMVAHGRTRRHNALGMLYELGDRSAAPRLRSLLGDPDLGIRWAATAGLGWSGDTSDTLALAALLDEPDATEWRSIVDVLGAELASLAATLARDEPGDAFVAGAARTWLGRVHAAAIVSIAELGGPAAADLLWSVTERFVAGLRLQALCGLGRLGDRRALEPLRSSLPEWLTEHGDAAARALLRLGDAGDLDHLVDAVLRSADRLPADDPERLRQLRREVDVVRFATSQVMPGRSADVDARFNRLLHRLADGGVHHALNGLHHHAPLPPPVEPLGPRVVPSRGMRFGVPEPPPGREPPAKFGGEPDWRDEPVWPLDERGEPMTFYCQLPVPGNRTGYVFVDNAGGESWEPLGDGNALVVQPGPAPSHVRTAALRTGPQYHAPVEERPPRYRRRLRMVPAEPLYVGFEDRADPVAWEWAGDAHPLPEGDQNKLGGTPYWWRGRDATPPGEGWRFAFQFQDHRTGHELTANPAVCYGFVTDDGRGAFLWC